MVVRYKCIWLPMLIATAPLRSESCFLIPGAITRAELLIERGAASARSIKAVGDRSQTTCGSSTCRRCLDRGTGVYSIVGLDQPHLSGEDEPKSLAYANCLV